MSGIDHVKKACLISPIKWNMHIISHSVNWKGLLAVNGWLRKLKQILRFIKHVLHVRRAWKHDIPFANLLDTSEIWPQPNVVSFHQSVHCFFYQRHIARIFEIFGAVGEKRWCNAKQLVNISRQARFNTGYMACETDDRENKEIRLPLSPDKSH